MMQDLPALFLFFPLDYRENQLFRFPIFRQAQALVNDDGQRNANQTLQRQEQAIRKGQQRQSPHDEGRHKRNQESRQDVLHLFFGRVVYQTGGIITVQEIGNNGGTYTAPQHIFNAEQHAQRKRTDCDYLFDDFQSQEQIRASLDLQDVQIDGMKGIQHAGKADNLQKTDGRQPFIAYQQHNQRLSHGSQPQHAGKAYQHRAFDDLAIGFLQAFRFVLYGT